MMETKLLRYLALASVIVLGLTLRSLDVAISITPEGQQDNLDVLLGDGRRLNTHYRVENIEEYRPIHREAAKPALTGENSVPTTLLSDSMPGKPYIILHFGPAKTGTSTLQNEMSLWKDRVFELDNVLYGGAYYVPGKHMGRLDVQGKFMDAGFKCQGEMAKARVEWELERNGTLKEHLQKTVPCFVQILAGLRPYHVNGTSLIFSNELKGIEQASRRIPGYKHRVPFDWFSIAEALGDEWNFILLIGHRPYLDWIPSAKFQVDKYSPKKKRMNMWPEAGGAAFQSLFPEDTLLSMTEGSVMQNRRVSEQRLLAYWNSRVKPFIHSETIYRHCAPYIPIRVLQLYDPVPVRTNFLCNIMPNTPRSCQASIEADERVKSELAHMNAGRAEADRIWFDRLVTAAVEQKLSDTNNIPMRAQMVNRVKHLHEVLLNRTIFDFPRKCPHTRALRDLRDFSWKKEKMLLGDRANLTLHEDLFQRNIKAAKYCSIDVLTTLKQMNWRKFFDGGWRNVQINKSRFDTGVITTSKWGQGVVGKRRGRAATRKRMDVGRLQMGES